MQHENEIDQLLTEAEALLQDQRPTEALALLDQARTLEPAHAWTQLFRGVAFGQLGRVEEAVDQLVRASDVHPEDIDLQVDAARHLSLLEHHQDAIVCANRALLIDTADAGAHAVHAEVLERLGRIADALPSRETAMSLDPDDMDNRYFLAVDLCDLGRYDDAMHIAEQLLAQLPDDADVLRLHGACLSYQGHHVQALTRWAELERIEGLTANLLHNRANTLDALGHFDEALATINEAILTEPDLAMNYYTRGMVHEHCHRPVSALDDYLAALTLDHNNLDAAINLIELATNMHMAPKMLTRINALLETDPTSAKLQYIRARLLMELGEFTQAQRTLEEAIRREPSLGISWYTLSMLYGITGNSEAALTAADRALQDFPDDPGIWLNRGQACEELQQFAEAMTCYDMAVALAPEDSAPWFHLGRLLLLSLERPLNARGALKEALRLQPENDTLICLLTLCYLRLGQADEALRMIRLLFTQHPGHPWGRVLRAAWHAQQGDMDAALIDLKAATAKGYDLRSVMQEPLFEPIWADPRFQETLNGSHGSRRE